MNFSKIDSYLKDVTEKKIIPCANISIGTSKELLHYHSYGHKQLYPNVETADTDTLFDIASLTKVISIWPCIMHLIENSYLKLSTCLGELWKKDIDPTYYSITIQDLLTHTSGITAQTYLKQYGNILSDIRYGLMNEPLEAQPCTKVIYSNRGYIILGMIIEKITGQSIDEYAKTFIWRPLGMNKTSYGPILNVNNIASTEIYPPKTTPLVGIVHDENAQLLGNIAGHAGVFSNLPDLSLFCQNLLLNRPRVITKESLKISFKDYTANLNENRGLGWNILYLRDTILFFHLGFTGTSIWLDPLRDLFVILLTNRVHPSRKNQNISIIRQSVRKFIWE